MFLAPRKQKALIFQLLFSLLAAIKSLHFSETLYFYIIFERRAFFLFLLFFFIFKSVLTTVVELTIM